MKNEDLDFCCSSTFRQGLPELTVDYRASDTFTGPPFRRQTGSQCFAADQQLDDLRQQIRGWQSSSHYWMSRALEAEEQLTRLHDRQATSRARPVAGFTGIEELCST